MSMAGICSVAPTVFPNDCCLLKSDWVTPNPFELKSNCASDGWLPLSATEAKAWKSLKMP
jgi:hypothetical protein